MSRFTIYKDNYADSTAVSNRFIDDFMADANDAQLKIYLYLIRMMSANLPTSVSEIADKFNHTEKDVVRSLRYWERKGLLNLDFDSRNRHWYGSAAIVDFCCDVASGFCSCNISGDR